MKTTENPADAILVIDASARSYARERAVLAQGVANFHAALEELRRKHLPGIRSAVARCADRQAVLQAQIEARPDLFVKPRTMTLYGIKLGFIKGKGKLIIDNAEKLIERIRAQFSKAKAESLIEVTQTPIKPALARLEAGELRKLGVSLVETGDAVFIKAVDTEVDKFVAQLLDEGSKAERGEKEAA